MTISEFKAWLDGFREAIGDAPSPDQWQKVVDKIATVKPEVITIPMAGQASQRFGQITSGDVPTMQKWSGCSQTFAAN